ncbi:Retrotransposon protein [Musa troglodytarum]|uniref:Retrotransposon protein n=1 Tax=Musa troglodytarum TaxID=320322 RepID=A0A9E7FD01_9LILI|nr:Retrotransposon protein [Musa troglodytarum]
MNLTGNWVGLVQLGLLANLTLLHINSNCFYGTLPPSLRRLTLLHEPDVSNNLLAGPFPDVVLYLPSLCYLNLRINEFEGAMPPELFDKDLDAIFLNHNRFHGCLPASLDNMSRTLNEIILMNNGLNSCFPPEIDLLRSLTVLDVSFNRLVGPLPNVDEMLSLEQLDVATIYSPEVSQLRSAVCRASITLPIPTTSLPGSHSSASRSNCSTTAAIALPTGRSSAQSTNVSRSCLIIPSTALLFPASPSCRSSLLRRSRHLLHLLHHRRRLLHSLHHRHLLHSRRLPLHPLHLRRCLHLLHHRRRTVSDLLHHRRQSTVHDLRRLPSTAIGLHRHLASSS